MKQYKIKKYKHGGIHEENLIERDERGSPSNDFRGNKFVRSELLDYDKDLAPKSGNLLLPDFNRPYYNAGNGELRSEYKIGIGNDSGEYNIPTVINGQQLSNEQAIQKFNETGMHMGKFDTWQDAEYDAQKRTGKYNAYPNPIDFNPSSVQPSVLFEKNKNKDGAIIDSEYSNSVQKLENGTRSMKIKKYNLGVQKVDVSPGAQGTESLNKAIGYGTTGMQYGSQLGSLAGPMGGAIGAGVGLVGGGIYGAVQGQKDAQMLDQQRMKEQQINSNIDYQNNNYGGIEKLQQKNLFDSVGYVSNRDIMAKNGMKYTPKKKIEVEKDEMIFRKDPNTGKTMLVADFKGGDTHREGGEDFIAQQGDTIFPGKTRDEIKSLVTPEGYVKNEKKFEMYKNQLPEDVESKEKFANGTTGIDINGIFNTIGKFKPPFENAKNNLEPSITPYSLESQFGALKQRQITDPEYNSTSTDNNGKISMIPLKTSTIDTSLKPSNLLNELNNKTTPIASSGPNPDYLRTIKGLVPMVGNSLYNLGLMNEKADVREATNLQFDNLKYEDRSNPLRKNNLTGLKSNNMNAANYAGGSASNMIAAMNANQNAYNTQDAQIENNEMMRADQIANQNVSINNQEAQLNSQYYDQNVTANEGNRARTRDIQRKGQLGIANTLNDSYSNFQTLQKDNKLQIENDRQYGLKEKAYENQLKYQNEMNNNKTLGDYQWLLANKDKFVGNGAQGEEEYLQMLEMAKSKLLKSGTLKK